MARAQGWRRHSVVLQTRDALATALRDPTVRLLFREPGSDAWSDAHCRPVRWPPQSTAAQALTTIGAEHGFRADDFDGRGLRNMRDRSSASPRPVGAKPRLRLVTGRER